MFVDCLELLWEATDASRLSAARASGSSSAARLPRQRFAPRALRPDRIELFVAPLPRDLFNNVAYTYDAMRACKIYIYVDDDAAGKLVS